METRDKKILVQSVSAVLIIVVLFNVYSGITVSKIGIPGLMEIEFNTGSQQTDTPNDPIGSNTVVGTNNPGQGGLTNDPVSNYDDFDEPGTTRSVDQNDQPVQPPVQPVERQVNLNGAWYGADGSEYEISYSSGTVFFTEYGLFGVTAEGSGTFQNNRMVIDYQTVFGTSGQATLDLSTNGQILSGVANDFTSGASTPLYLTRY